jgi:chemotaxis protein methyltransferase WspC
MAMALLDAELPPDRFRIDAMDISERALDCARRAVYGRKSFRGGNLDFRDRHFEPAPPGYHVRHTVRRQVRLVQGNLLTSPFLRRTNAYDVIFSRNVLIYFDRAAQDRAIAVLARLLTGDGHLFVGSSETGALLNRGFVPARLPMAFAFRKPGATQPAGKPAAAHPRRPGRPPRPADSLGVPAAAPVAAPAPLPDPRAVPAHDLERAAHLGDQGRFPEAAAECERYLRRYGPSADAFRLLGLIRGAGGDQSEAATCFRKALYLDPNHYDVMVHLALLMERDGRSAQAGALRRRAARLAAPE